MIDKDLQVFIPNTEMIEDSIKQFVEMYSLRTRKSNEYWLVDIGYWTSNVEDRTGFYDKIRNDLKGLKLDLDDDLYFFEEKDKSVHIWEHYAIGYYEIKKSVQQEVQRKISYLGSWNLDAGFQMIDIPKWYRRKNLEGHHFRVAAMPSNPYVTGMIPAGFSTDGSMTYRFTGFFAEIYDNLQGIMNFTYEVIKPPDRQWGAIQPDGTWNGMVKLLANQEIDMGIAEFTVTQERSAVMTFATPITEIYHSLFIMNPAEKFNFTAYIEPMHWSGWVGLLVFIATIPAFLYLTVRFGGKDPAYHEFTIGKCYVYLCSALTMRGWSDLPSKLPAQIALMSLIFFATMMWWHWEAMVISYLAVVVTVLPFKDIPDLVTNTQFRIILNPGTAFEDAFKTSPDPYWKIAWTDRVQPHLEEHAGFNRQSLADKMETDGVSAWYDNYFGVITLDAYINCKILGTPGKYDFKPYAYGFQKDSPFLPIFNYYLNEMKEKGSLKQIQVKYEPASQVCPDYSGRPLGIGAVFSLFVVFFVGIGIAFILFGLETFTQAFGMKWSIFNSYGVVEHPDEFFENDTTALFTENVSLKKRILMLEKLVKSLKSPKDVWTD